MDKEDEDGDGVNDLSDECPHSDLKFEVDSKGCALDADNDGVPDAIDVEPNSKHTVVDDKGRALSDEEIEVMYLLYSSQMAGHEKYTEYKEKYPELFKKYSNQNVETIKLEQDHEEEK
jgi:hypothetical protein